MGRLQDTNLCVSTAFSDKVYTFSNDQNLLRQIPVYIIKDNVLLAQTISVLRTVK